MGHCLFLVLQLLNAVALVAVFSASLINIEYLLWPCVFIY